MNLVTLTCLLSLVPIQVAAAPRPPSPEIAHFLELLETTRRGAVLQLQHELRQQKNASTKSSAAKISQLETRIKGLQNGTQFVLPTISFPPQVGAIGRLPGDSCYVEQIISPGEVLVRCHFRVTVTTVRNFTAYRDSVVHPVEAVIRGWDQRVAEGQDMHTAELFEVVGKERYTTEKGASRAVLIFRPIPWSEIQPYLPASRSTAAPSSSPVPQEEP